MVNTIGERMKQRREELSISIAEIVEATGLSKTTIYRYETGDIKQIKIPVIESIATILNCNPAWLLGKSDDKYKREVEDYVEIRDRGDISKVLDGLTQYIANKDDLKYNGLDLMPGARNTLVKDLQALKEKVDKMYGFE